MIKDEFSVLFARIDDLCRRAERGEVGVSGFLSPREQHFILKYLKERGHSCTCFMYGGYDSAERKRAFILPEFIELPSVYGDISEFLDADPLCALFIAGSGYRNLSHRDYLGSVLGLGIDRSVVGDIIVSDSDGGAFIFCDTSISDFILIELKKVASDTVKVKRVEVDGSFCPQRSFAHISDTVASPRLDCVVAALCSLSRDKASCAVRSGIVEIEYECEDAPDRTVIPPCVISVRGYGKFRINSLSEHTRKGRIRLDADKYV